MHVGFLTPEYPHPSLGGSGGLGTSIKNLSEALIESGHSVTLFVCNQHEDRVFHDNDIIIHLLKKRFYKVGGFYFYRKYVAKYINRNSKNIDILEAPDWTGLTAFCNFNIPHVIKLNGSDTYFCHLAGRPQKKKNKWFEKLALRNADAISSASTYTGKLTKALFELSKSITTCYNLIKLDSFVPAVSSPQEKYILNFGTVIRKKGVIELAKAFELVHKNSPDVFLYYLGGDVVDATTGRSTIELIKEQLSESALKKTKFISKVPYSEVLDYVNNSQIVCLPSHAEAFPMTWLESMALQKPFIGSNVGWSPEIVEDGTNGFAVDPYDSGLLSKRIIQFLQSSELRNRLATAGRKTILEKFNTKKLVDSNLNFYRQVIDEYHRP